MFLFLNNSVFLFIEEVVVEPEEIIYPRPIAGGIVAPSVLGLLTNPIVVKKKEKIIKIYIKYLPLNISAKMMSLIYESKHLIVDVEKGDKENHD